MTATCASLSLLAAYLPSPNPPRTCIAAGAVVCREVGGVRLTIRVLGCEVLHIDTDRDDRQSQPDRGDCTTYPIGFTPSPGDQRWERGLEP